MYDETTLCNFVICLLGWLLCYFIILYTTNHGIIGKRNNDDKKDNIFITTVQAGMVAGFFLFLGCDIAIIIFSIVRYMTGG